MSNVTNTVSQRVDHTMPMHILPKPYCKPAAPTILKAHPTLCVSSVLDRREEVESQEPRGSTGPVDQRYAPPPTATAIGSYPPLPPHSTEPTASPKHLRGPSSNSCNNPDADDPVNSTAAASSTLSDGNSDADGLVDYTTEAPPRAFSDGNVEADGLVDSTTAAPLSTLSDGNPDVAVPIDSTTSTPSYPPTGTSHPPLPPSPIGPLSPPKYFRGPSSSGCSSPDSAGPVHSTTAAPLCTHGDGNPDADDPVDSTTDFSLDAVGPTDSTIAAPFCAPASGSCPPLPTHLTGPLSVPKYLRGPFCSGCRNPDTAGNVDSTSAFPLCAHSDGNSNADGPKDSIDTAKPPCTPRGDNPDTVDLIDLATKAHLHTPAGENHLPLLLRPTHPSGPLPPPKYLTKASVSDFGNPDANKCNTSFTSINKHATISKGVKNETNDQRTHSDPTHTVYPVHILPKTSVSTIQDSFPTQCVPEIVKYFENCEDLKKGGAPAGGNPDVAGPTDSKPFHNPAASTLKNKSPTRCVADKVKYFENFEEFKKTGPPTGGNPDAAGRINPATATPPSTLSGGNHHDTHPIDSMPLQLSLALLVVVILMLLVSNALPLQLPLVFLVMVMLILWIP
ncbi:hypothetical protein JOB18_034992 [Solea senegalensis]|uniref:Uncharacterized protein n=1 Tax=Solea senegalensis TaxID=28829 RepID=A0AAV6QY87_SOLSE|nr:hypothetical protein JOB18_034992 [Solea senegalensis]